jgi:two-component system, LytTR family, sensor kinase
MATKRSFRLIISLAIAIIMGLLSYANSFLEKSGHSNWIYVIMLFIIYFIWEVNTQVAKYIQSRKKDSFNKNLIQQITVSYLINFVIINVIYASLKLYSIAHYERPGSTYSFSIFIIVNATFLLLFILVSGLNLGFTFIEKYKQSEINAEKLLKESMHAKLESLKVQVSPHFLFNNLNILGALIEKEPQTAKAFLEKFSEVYRYVLVSKNKELITLKEELEFLDSYIYLLQKRFDNNLKIYINCSYENNYHLPPICLQLLLENAIKHNIISSKKPLSINIFTQGDNIVIENNLQKKESVESGTGTGLFNITNRYSYFTDLKVDVQETNEHYIVKLPLLKMEAVNV